MTTLLAAEEGGHCLVCTPGLHHPIICESMVTFGAGSGSSWKNTERVFVAVDNNRFIFDTTAYFTDDTIVRGDQ